MVKYVLISDRLWKIETENLLGVAIRRPLVNSTKNVIEVY